ncbi:unnamed protein product [Mytilus coruscus]|uniref:Integrase catalytic domain-containing protein n=1 Tax=Mytilus coruscus TaxID=42192 RepID=A0A6J8CD28_MYTCO|nr:unnamed protein product [Mytilus coruscus]
MVPPSSSGMQKTANTVVKQVEEFNKASMQDIRRNLVEENKLCGLSNENLLAVTKDKVQSILKMCHDHSGHKGLDKTVNKITERYYWKGVVCDTKLLNNEVISDCGGEFNSKVLDHLFKDYNIRHITTSPYHPQSNGLVENFNGTLKTMINKLIDKEPKKWDVFVNEALFAYRVGIHNSTKVSPFEAMYARKQILINEKGIGPIFQPNEINEEMVDELVARRKIIENKIRENVQMAQQRQKVNYDKRLNVSEQTYVEGQKVLLKNFRHKAGLATVQQLRYQGPYLIKKYCGKGNFTNLKLLYQPDANNNNEDDDVGDVQMEDVNLATASRNENVANVSAMNKSVVTVAQVRHISCVYQSDSDVEVPSGQVNFMLTDDRGIFEHIL